LEGEHLQGIMEAYINLLRFVLSADHYTPHCPSRRTEKVIIFLLFYVNSFTKQFIRCLKLLQVLMICPINRLAVALKKYFLNYYRTFEALAKYCLTNPPSPTNLIIMLSFFTTTAMQRRFSVQISMAGTAKLISVFIMGIKPNLPEVRFVSKL
jgi:hypothetical protein